MSLRDRLAAWSAATTRESQPRGRHRVPRFTEVGASLVDGALRVDVFEDLPDRSDRATIHAAAQFGAVLELIAHPADDVPQHRRQTVWTLQSADFEANADDLGRKGADLVLIAPPLDLLLGLIPTDPGTEISLVRASWSELLVTDLDHGVTHRIPGTWTVFDTATHPSRPRTR